MKTTIILLSHYKEAQTWVNNYLHERKIKKIAYIMDAKKQRLATNPEYIFKDKLSFEQSGFTVDFINLESLDKEVVEQKLKNYEAIYVKGGNTFDLLSAMKKSGFDKIVRNLIDQGIIYIGESAGSYVACPTIEMATWGQHTDINRANLTDLTALNLVPFLVTAHYKKEYDPIIQPRIKELKYETKLLTDQELILIENGLTKWVSLIN
jgi:dipeptidase E